MKNIKPYRFEYTRLNSYVVYFGDEKLLSIDNTSLEYVTNMVNLLNGAFMNGMIHQSMMDEQLMDKY